MLRSVTFLVSLAILFADQASAAPPPVQERHALRMRSESAQCLIKRRGAFVRAWLATLPGTAAEKKAIRPAEQDFTACFPSWPLAYASTWNHEGIRRGLVRELLQPRLSDLSDQPPPGLNRRAWYGPEQASDANAAPALLANDLGFCLARSNWITTRALVRAQEGSAEEETALKAMVPHIAGCLPPGQKLRLDTDRLRSILVETVYHATIS
jgi:hypothetical protein